MKRILILKSGQEYAISGEDGKYYICEDGTTFRKLNPEIAEIKKVKEQKEEKQEDAPADEPVVEEKPKKKKTASKKGE